MRERSALQNRARPAAGVTVGVMLCARECLGRPYKTDPNESSKDARDVAGTGLNTHISAQRVRMMLCNEMVKRL